MDSGLTPREIQTRIRGGEQVEAVAASAGVSTEHIQVFAGPVMAERRHVAGTAQAGPVRRRGESSSGRALSAVVAERLNQLSLTTEDVTWDAWRDPDRRWTVKASFAANDTTHEALFTYDLRGRFSIAANDDARWLIGEATAAQKAEAEAAAAAAKKKDPDSEETLDLNDEMALVRATQAGQKGSGRSATSAKKASASNPQPTDESATESKAMPTKPRSTGSSPKSTRRSRKAAAPAPSEPADYTEAELTEVGGVYDIVPSQGDMDVLYDMLSSFNEDSVNIYAGLTSPVVGEAADEADDEADVDQDQLDQDQLDPYQLEQVAADDSDDEAEAGDSERPGAPVQPAVLDQDSATVETASTGAGDEVAESASRPSLHLVADTDEDASSPDDSEVSEPQQDSLLTEEEEPTLVRPRADLDQADPPAKPKSSKRKRASVPSWDEIMFGAPAPKDPKG